MLKQRIINSLIDDSLVIFSGGGQPSYDPVFANNTWEQIVRACDNDEVPETWSVGDMKPITIGDETINMQIAGIYADNLADSSGDAVLSLVTYECLKSSHRMNPARTPSSAPYNEGTGTIGGWEKSEMREYLQETIFGRLPVEVQNAIVEVKKGQRAYNANGSSFNQTVPDTLWLLSNNEWATNGRYYELLGGSADKREKKKVGGSNPIAWWLRQTASLNYFYSCDADGGTSGHSVTTSYGVVFGFCLGRHPSPLKLMKTLRRTNEFDDLGGE